MILQVPADIRRSQHILPALDIGLVLKDKPFYRGVQATASIEQRPVDPVALGGRGDDVIHVKRSDRDRVDCGPGRDTVFATKRKDRLRRCERIRR